VYRPWREERSHGQEAGSVLVSISYPAVREAFRQAGFYPRSEVNMLMKTIDIKCLAQNEFDILKLILNAQAFGVLGIMWTKSVAWHTDFETGNIVFQYE
jgi:hypothetical protein